MDVKVVGSVVLISGLKTHVVKEGEFRLVEVNQIDDVGTIK